MQILRNTLFKTVPVIALTLALTILSSFIQATTVAHSRRPPRPVDGALERFPLSSHGSLIPESQPAALEGVAMADLANWSKIVFQSVRNGNWEVYVAKGDGSGRTRLTEHKAMDIHPRLDRGCTRIVFASDRTGSYEIHTMNADGSGLTRLTPDGADDVNPAWSPDGTKIAFQSYRDGQAEIYVMNVDGSSQTRLTAHSEYDGDPAWSPDGTKIAFASRRTGGYRIWMMNADGSGKVQLSDQDYSENPAWAPDGSLIAYDSDGDGDGWQELWLMNADGSNQRQVYDPGSSEIDAWVGSWSPDGKYVAFTLISFIYHQGHWYWLNAYLGGYDVISGSATPLSSPGEDWNPDWQTHDTQMPSSEVNGLPATSPAPFTVSWSGSDIGLSGIRSYDVQVKDGTEGDWTDWQVGTAATTASYLGVGGHTYYFRARARDNAYNEEDWSSSHDASTTVEALPPVTAVGPLSPYSHNGPTVYWGGSDPGNSGIQTYSVQYRDGDTGDWTDWMGETTATSASFFGTAGHAYYFRSRATDRAQNTESWPPGDGDTHTTLYTWRLTGLARDNAGVPAAGVVVTTTPAALAMIPSDRGGNLTAYVADDLDTYEVAWGKTGYSSLPATSLDGTRDRHLDVVMPPADNIVRNWGFENGSLGPDGWTASGVITPTVITTARHTGNYAALLGLPFTLTAALDISNSSGSSESPQLAVGESGTIHTMWSEYEYPAGNYRVSYAQRGNDGMWHTESVVSASEGGIYPELAVDRKGSVHAAWYAWTTEGQYEIFHTWRDAEGIWSNPQNISNNPGDSYGPRLAVDNDGILHLVWIDNTSGPENLYYAYRDSSGTWSAPQDVSGDIDVLFSLQLAIDVGNIAHILWVGYDRCIHYAQRDHNGLWSDPRLITCSNHGSDPRMAVDEQSNVHVVWYDFEYDSILYVQRNSSGYWSDPVDLPGELDGPSPIVTADRHGNTHVIWMAGGGVYHAWKRSDGNWFGPQRIGHSSSEDAPRLAVDESGAVHVVWQYRPSSYSWNWHVYYAQWNDDRGWTGPWLLSDDIISGVWMQTQLVVERGGSVHMVWIDQSEGDQDVYYVGSPLVEHAGNSTVAQAIAVPVTMSTPIFSFLYQLGGTSPGSGSRFDVQISSGVAITTLTSMSSNTEGWTHYWADLSPWVGQNVTLTLSTHQASGSPRAWAYLDEVTIGAGRPDLWVSKRALASTAMPGDQVAFAIAYGNRGAAPAGSVQVTGTLPDELSFMDASPPHDFNTLVWAWEWNVGDVPAKSGPFTIVLTASVASTATLYSTLTSTASIGTVSPELETANNTAKATIFVGHQINLPVVIRRY
jgi:uncharacterized repeat protein (TIGR01451 family)